MTDYMSLIEREHLRTDLPAIAIGDYVRVHLKVKEGARERIQVFEGTIIARKSGGIRETVTIRRVSYGVGVERVLPLHSPKISKIEIVRRGKIRRAKLYYLRDRVGKAARVKERLEQRGAKKAREAIAAEAESVAVSEAPVESGALSEAETAAETGPDINSADNAAANAAVDNAAVKGAEIITEAPAETAAEGAENFENAGAATVDFNAEIADGAANAENADAAAESENASDGSKTE